MQVNGLQHSQVLPISGSSQRSQPIQSSLQPTSQTIHAADELDLSLQAQALVENQPAGASQASGGIRWEKVAELRQSIAAGNYETPEKMSAALDRVLDAYA